MHSVIWNHDASFKGKNFVVGKGCSANQVVPALLRDYSPASITQLIRSKHYIIPPIPEVIQWLYRFTSSTRLRLIAFRLLIASFAEKLFPTMFLLKAIGLYSSANIQADNPTNPIIYY